MRPTYLCISDIPDNPPRRWVDVEKEQEDEIISKLGLTLWGHLGQMEAENERNSIKTD